MPRQSLADRTTPRPEPVQAVTLATLRPEPPAHLSAAAAACWRELLAMRTPDYWDGPSLILAERLAVSLAESRRVQTAVDAMDPADHPLEFARLSNLQDKLTARVSALASRLRLTKQSQIGPRAAAREAAQGPSSLDAMRARYAR
jgi:hypothetical protein